MRRQTLIVMVKEPHPGRVKTRLGKDIGMTRAAWWYRHQTRALLRRLRDRRWDIVLAVTPDREGWQSRIWPADLPRIPQGSGDLGQRMARVFKATRGPTLLIGSDIPGIRSIDIDFAFSRLRDAESVVGPAMDGGYWLVGLKHPGLVSRSLFKGVRWSTKHALADTLLTLPGSTSSAGVLNDIDTAADLRAFRVAT